MSLGETTPPHTARCVTAQLLRQRRAVQDQGDLSRQRGEVKPRERAWQWERVHSFTPPPRQEPGKLRQELQSVFKQQIVTVGNVNFRSSGEAVTIFQIKKQKEQKTTTLVQVHSVSVYLPSHLPGPGRTAQGQERQQRETEVSRAAVFIEHATEGAEYTQGK